jgi:hypothetical protein
LNREAVSCKPGATWQTSAHVLAGFGDGAGYSANNLTPLFGAGLSIVWWMGGARVAHGWR